MLEAVIRDAQGVFFPTMDQYVDLMESLWSSDYKFCSDLCGVDYLEMPSRKLPEGVKAERFEIVVNVTSFETRSRLRVRLQVQESNPHLPTLYGLYPGTEAMEREVYDLLGMVFDGHPDLSRILLPEEWEGHPLRKDYSVGRIPVQFKASTAIR